MSEEPPKPSEDNNENEAQNDPIDLNERRQYHIVISGGNVAVPIDRIDELPAAMVEKFLEAGSEQIPTAGQQTWREVLAKYLGEELYPGIADGDLDPSSITIEPASDGTETPT